MKDLDEAIRVLREATESLAAIAGLPPASSAVVYWPHNRLTWTRRGQDSWSPTSMGGDPYLRVSSDYYPSRHVALHPYEIVRYGT